MEEESRSMSDEQDYQDYKDYQDYQAYQKSQDYQDYQAYQKSQASQAPQQGMLSKAVDFAKGLPTSAIDLIPGAKDQRLQNQASQDQYYQSHPRPADDGINNLMVNFTGPESAMGLIKSIPNVRSALGKLFAPAAQRSEVLSKVKEASDLMPFLASKADEAKHALMQTQVAPRMAIQQSLADEAMVPLDTAKLSGIHPEVDQMIQTAKDSAGNSAQGVAEAQPGAQAPQSDTMNFPAKEALKIRGLINKATPAAQFDYPTFKTMQVNAGNHVRDALSTVDPAMQDLSEGMENAYNAQKSVFGAKNQKSPLGATYPGGSGQAGLAKTANLRNFDNLAGEDAPSMEQLGKDVKGAQDKLQAYTPAGLKKLFTMGLPKEAFDLAATPIQRGYDAVGAAVHNTPKSSDAAKLYYLLRGGTPDQGSGQQ